MEENVRYQKWDGIFERSTGVVLDRDRRSIATRRLWLRWVGRLKKAIAGAEAEGWSKSTFKGDKTTRKLQGVIGQFCKGRIPIPKSEGCDDKFNSLFEIISPPSSPKAYPVGMSYTGIPVGSSRGVGVSPSASQFVPPTDSSRYENYVDGPEIKSRRRGKSGYVKIGGGKVVRSSNP